jgi:hypothetical protein
MTDGRRNMSPSTFSIRFDQERPIGQRWVILETSARGFAVVRARYHSQQEAERALATLVPLGIERPQDAHREGFDTLATPDRRPKTSGNPRLLLLEAIQLAAGPSRGF